MIRTHIGQQNWIAEKYSAGQVLLRRLVEVVGQSFASGERKRKTTPINSLFFTLFLQQTPTMKKNQKVSKSLMDNGISTLL